MQVKNILILILSLVFFQTIQSQNVTGIVLGSDQGADYPLPGVNIHWAGTTMGTSSNQDGVFSIDLITESKHLVFSFVGYISDTIEVTSPSPIKVLLISDMKLDEVTIAKKNKGTYLKESSILHTVEINQTELCKAACCNLAESFETNASVDVTYNDAVSGARQIQMLGLAGVYSQLQVENSMGLQGIATHYGLGFVPGPWMESIQVSKGAAAVVNGYESITGQINVEYRKPSAPEKLFLNAFISNDLKYELNAFHSASISEKWSMATFVHGRYFDQPVDHNHDGFLDEPLNRQVNFLSRFDREGNHGSITRIAFQYLNDTRTGGQKGFQRNMLSGAGNPYGVIVDNERFSTFFKSGYIFEGEPHRSLAFMGNALFHKMNSVYGLKTYNGDEFSFTGTLLYSTEIGETEQHELTAGINFSGSVYHQKNQLSHFDFNRSVPGVFAEYTYHPSENLTLMSGLRYDYHDFFGGFVTPRFHLKYNFLPQQSLRLSVGKGYRQPLVMAETSNQLASGRDLIIEENRIMENAWNYGATLTSTHHLFNREFMVAVEYYRTHFITQMMTDQESHATEIRVYESNQTSYANSYQIDVRYEILPRLDLTAAIRFNDIQHTLGNQLISKPLISKYKGLVTLNYTDTHKHWMFDYNTQFNGSGRVPLTPGTPDELSVSGRFNSYIIHNAQITRFFKKASIYIGCENIGDFRQPTPVIGANDPYHNYFDATRVWGPVMGRLFYTGVRFSVMK